MEVLLYLPVRTFVKGRFESGGFVNLTFCKRNVLKHKQHLNGRFVNERSVNGRFVGVPCTVLCIFNSIGGLIVGERGGSCV
jgi:hypothetical protein